MTAPDQAASAPPAASPRSTSAPPRQRQGSLLALMAIVISVGQLAAVAYWYQREFVPAHAHVESRFSAMDAETARLQRDLARLQTAAASVSAAQHAVDAELAEERVALAALRQTTAALTAARNKPATDWSLAEVEYLLHIADQRLTLAQDVVSAQAALHAAAAELQQLDRPALLPLREQLDRDIAALAAVSLPDSAGLTAALSSTLAQVERLPLKDQGAATTAPVTTTPTAAGWRGFAQAVWRDLLSLVQVRDADETDSLLFDPKLRAYQQQELRLELAGALLAVMRRDTADFRLVSGLIQDRLAKYYDTHDDRVAALLTRLQAAVDIELAPALPGPTGSLAALRAYRTETPVEPTPSAVLPAPWSEP